MAGGRPSTLAIRVTSDSKQARRDLGQLPGSVSSSLGKIKAAGVAGALAVGAAVAAALGDAFGKALEQGKITAKLRAQLGATKDDAAKYGKVAGKLFAGTMAEDFQQGADAIRAIMGDGLLDTGATEQQIQSLSTKALDLANAFDQDLAGGVNAASTMLRTGLVSSADEAFDVLTAGFQKTGTKAGDLLDTFTEYPVQFKALGIGAKAGMGLVSQAVLAGARDTDVAVDALKELADRSIDGSKASTEAFKAMGMDATQMAQAFGKGGDSAYQAFQKVMDGLRGIPDKVERNTAAMGLFGEKAVDMKDALYAFDPSTAVSALDEVGGAAERAGNSLRDNASSRLEEFKRTAEQAVVGFLGDQVIPALEKTGTVLGTVFGPAWQTISSFWTGTLVPAAREVHDWFTEKIAPGIQKTLTPVLEGGRAAFEKVKDAIDRNSDKLKPMIQFVKLAAEFYADKLYPALGKVGGYLLGTLGGALAAAIDQFGSVAGAIGWVIDKVSSLVGWLERIKWPSPPGWLKSAGSWVGSLFSADPETAAAPASVSYTATYRAAAPALSPRVMLRPRTSVTVVIDGQQLQGRISRTVTTALNADGARLAAGGWA